MTNRIVVYPRAGPWTAGSRGGCSGLAALLSPDACYTGARRTMCLRSLRCVLEETRLFRRPCSLTKTGAGRRISVAEYCYWFWCVVLIGLVLLFGFFFVWRFLRFDISGLFFLEMNTLWLCYNSYSTSYVESLPSLLRSYYQIKLV